MSQSKPEPFAQGTFTKTSFDRMLVHIYQHSLTGTLELSAPGCQFQVLFENGIPFYLWNRETNRSMPVEAALLGCFPLREGQFAFYLNIRLIDMKTSKPNPTDPMKLLLKACRDYASCIQMNPIVNSLNGVSFHLTKAGNVERFGFQEKEMLLCNYLKASAMTLQTVRDLSGIDNDVKKRVLFVLIVARQLSTSKGRATMPPQEKAHPETPQLSAIAEASRHVVGNRQRKVTSATANETASNNAASAPNTVPGKSANKRPSGKGKLSGPQLRRQIETKIAVFADQNYYELLEITPDAAIAEIPKAFFQAAKIFHPDRFSKPELQDLKHDVSKLFARLSEAHSTLSDSERRAEYDEYMKNPGKQQEADRQEQEVERAVRAENEFQKAHVLLRGHKMAEAFAMASSAHELAPGEDEYAALFMYLKVIHDHADADAYVERMRHMATGNPKSENIQFACGHVLKNANRMNEAKDFFKAVLQINPHNIEAGREIRFIDLQLKNSGKFKKPTFFGKRKK